MVDQPKPVGEARGENQVVVDESGNPCRSAPASTRSADSRSPLEDLDNVPDSFEQRSDPSILGIVVDEHPYELGYLTDGLAKL